MSSTQAQPKFWSGNEIRETFLRFFEGKGHRRVRSSSLVPHGDPTLLFTNAGMNQFKDVFLGLEKREYDKATSAQKCVRAGGKHNDLENVGFTKRHHTFFEMLGNFSFGDYFKEKAIPYAWELITSPEWFAIPKDKLYVTIFGGAEVAPGTTLGVDEEARKFWLAQNVPAERIVPIPGLKENFWAMGDTGPCGPCSEIHYDMGPEASEQGHTDCKFPCDCGRYVEIWNLVFMQFDRQAGVDDKGAPWGPEIGQLPAPCIDTGMGLERVAAVLQGVISNYDTDLFRPLIKRAAELTGAKIGADRQSDASLRIIADHARASTFLIADGVVPDKGDRGYVLRKIVRRAIRHARLLGVSTPVLAEMVTTVGEVMGDAYPEIVESAGRVSALIRREEGSFLRITDLGLRRLRERFGDLRRIEAKSLEQYLHDQDEKARLALEQRLHFLRSERNLANASDEELRSTTLELFGPEFAPDAEKWVRETARRKPRLDGQTIFQLYDTYGLALDFIEEEAKEQGFEVDTAGFEQAMQEQRNRARASWKGGSTKEAGNPAYAKIAETYKTEPDFYVATSAKDARIEAIVTKNGTVGELKAGESGEVVLDRTVIYAESGGQIADTGAFYDPSGSQVVAEVSGAYYPVARLVAHRVTAKDTLRVGDRVSVQADAERRARIMRNHSGTHLVHAALRNILGTHVKQAGSLNAPERLRFDFSHFAAIAPEELRDIEQQVNEHILSNAEMQTDVTSIDEALASGALAFFGDKYPEQNVRVVTIPDAAGPRGFYSKELCGGTHVKRTGDIGVFKIVSEQSVAAGVRRIEAITGGQALADYQRALGLLRDLAGKLNVGEDALLASVEKMSQSAKQLEKQLGEQKRKGALSQVDELLQNAHTVKGVKVVSAQVDDVDREGLRQLVDTLRQRLGSGVVALGTALDGKAAIIAGVTKDLTNRLNAGKIAQALAEKIGGKGGGRPDLGEAGGKDTSALKSALGSIYSFLDPLL